MDMFATNRRNDVELRNILSDLSHTLSRFETTMNRAKKKWCVSG
jgi:hypothetical protein